MTHYAADCNVELVANWCPHTQSYTHDCTDAGGPNHDGPHQCICGRTWTEADHD